MRKIDVFDTTLRDGAQAQGISFSVEDKLKILKGLDDLGVSYIEAGNPGSNMKEMELFEKARNIRLENAQLVAFGSTRRADIRPEDDLNLKALLQSDAKIISLFGKCWDYHVSAVLKTTNLENFKMIESSIDYLVKKGRTVFFDAEHFFDGYTANPGFAMKCLEIAADAGASVLCLCDTNGGTFPDTVSRLTAEVVNRFRNKIGIHCHDDGGMAVANTIMALKAGAAHFQATINGYGERCGNADMCTIIPNLQLKLGYQCILGDKLQELTAFSKNVSEISNIRQDKRAPFVGRYAFAHKSGMHIDAVDKVTDSFEHIDPELVGNTRRFLMSEFSGRSNLIHKIQKVDPGIQKNDTVVQKIAERLKELEFEGYQFEGAEGSFELEIKKILGTYKPSFALTEFKVMVDEPSVDGVGSAALIKIKVNGEEDITADEGQGPINALDKAIRKALTRFYPEITQMKLTDFKVRVIDSAAATAAKVRVLIESTDGTETWTTIGVSSDVILASWKALVDSIEYKLSKSRTD